MIVPQPCTQKVRPSPHVVTHLMNRGCAARQERRCLVSLIPTTSQRRRACQTPHPVHAAQGYSPSLPSLLCPPLGDPQYGALAHRTPLGAAGLLSPDLPPAAPLSAALTHGPSPVPTLPASPVVGLSSNLEASPLSHLLAPSHPAQKGQR